MCNFVWPEKDVINNKIERARIKDGIDSFIGYVLLAIFTFLIFAIVWGLWGGNPNGAFAKIRKLEEKTQDLQKRIDATQAFLGAQDLNIWTYILKNEGKVVTIKNVRRK